MLDVKENMLFLFNAVVMRISCGAFLPPLFCEGDVSNRKGQLSVYIVKAILLV